MTHDYLAPSSRQFLQINGWNVRTTQTQFTREEIGAGYQETYQFGQYNKSSRRLRKKATFTTAPMLRSDFEILCGILEGAGDLIKFDAPYSRKGASFVGQPLVVSSYAKTANANTSQAPYGTLNLSDGGIPFTTTSSLQLKNAANLVASENVRRTTNQTSSTTGFTATNGATITSDAQEGLFEDRSLKFDTTTATSGDGVHASVFFLFATTATLGASYTISFYGRKVDGPQNALRIRVVTTDGATIINPAYESAKTFTSNWSRAYATFSGLSASTTYRAYIQEDVESSISIFNIAGIKVESGTVPTNYVATSAAAADTYARGRLSNFGIYNQSISIISRCMMQFSDSQSRFSGTQNTEILKIRTGENKFSSNDEIRVFLNPSDSYRLTCHAKANGGTTQVFAQTTTLGSTLGAYGFAFASRNYTEHHEQAARLYGINGQIHAQTNTNLLDFDFYRKSEIAGRYYNYNAVFGTPATFEIGSSTENAVANIVMSDTYILPYAVSTAYLNASMASYSSDGGRHPAVPFPNFYVTCPKFFDHSNNFDALANADPGVICNGQVLDITDKTKGYIGGTFYSNLYRVNFEVCEAAPFQGGI